jgi:hypothetical protein
LGSTEVLEKNDYYPFGLNHNFNVLSLANPAYKYQYNGKELQEETGWSDPVGAAGNDEDIINYDLRAILNQ